MVEPLQVSGLIDRMTRAGGSWCTDSDMRWRGKTTNRSDVDNRKLACRRFSAICKSTKANVSSETDLEYCTWVRAEETSIKRLNGTIGQETCLNRKDAFLRRISTRRQFIFFRAGERRKNIERNEKWKWIHGHRLMELSRALAHSHRYMIFLALHFQIPSTLTFLVILSYFLGPFPISDNVKMYCLTMRTHRDGYELLIVCS